MPQPSNVHDDEHNSNASHKYFQKVVYNFLIRQPQRTIRKSAKKYGVKQVANGRNLNKMNMLATVFKVLQSKPENEMRDDMLETYGAEFRTFWQHANNRLGISAEWSNVPNPDELEKFIPFSPFKRPKKGRPRTSNARNISTIPTIPKQTTAIIPRVNHSSTIDVSSIVESEEESEQLEKIEEEDDDVDDVDDDEDDDDEIEAAPGEEPFVPSSIVINSHHPPKLTVSEFARLAVILNYTHLCARWISILNNAHSYDSNIELSERLLNVWIDVAHFYNSVNHVHYVFLPESLGDLDLEFNGRRRRPNELWDSVDKFMRIFIEKYQSFKRNGQKVIALGARYRVDFDTFLDREFESTDNMRKIVGLLGFLFKVGTPLEDESVMRVFTTAYSDIVVIDGSGTDGGRVNSKDPSLSNDKDNRNENKSESENENESESTKSVDLVDTPSNDKETTVMKQVTGQTSLTTAGKSHADVDVGERNEIDDKSVQTVLQKQRLLQAFKECMDMKKGLGQSEAENELKGFIDEHVENVKKLLRCDKK